MSNIVVGTGPHKMGSGNKGPLKLNISLLIGQHIWHFWQFENVMLKLSIRHVFE